MDVAFIAAREADTVQWAVLNVAEAAAGIRGILSGGPGPGPEGSLSLTEPATRFTGKGVGVHVAVFFFFCGCLFTVNWKDRVFV